MNAHPSLSTATVDSFTHPTHRGLGFVPSGKIIQQLLSQRRCCFWVFGASVADPLKELSFGCESLIRCIGRIRRLCVVVEPRGCTLKRALGVIKFKLRKRDRRQF